MTGSAVAELREQLLELAKCGNQQARRAANYWLAALGSLARLLRDDDTNKEALAAKTLTFWMRGLDEWLVYAAIVASTGEDVGPTLRHVGALKARAEENRSLGDLFLALRLHLRSGTPRQMTDPPAPSV